MLDSYRGRSVNCADERRGPSDGPDRLLENNENAAARANARLRDAWPLKELYDRGDLGHSLSEARQLWRDVQRFVRLYRDARGDSTDESVLDDWRDILEPYLQLDQETFMVPLNLKDGPYLSDDLQFEDTDFKDSHIVVDCAGFNSYRDLEAPLRIVLAHQILASMKQYLGSGFFVLEAAIWKRWSLHKIGQTEPGKDRATVAGVGRGLVVSSIRQLSLFFLAMDRLERNDAGIPGFWKLIGTSSWLFETVSDSRRKSRF